MKKAKLRKLGDLLQLSYNLPHRVHVARTYPLHSPNGSTIIIYGHDAGLSLIWRGGLPIKSTEDVEEPTKSRANGVGATSDEPMMIDSEDDEAPDVNEPPPTEDLEFEEQEEEYDPSHPYNPIIQVLNLPLETQVLNLSFLQLPNDLDQSSLGSSPKLLLKDVIVAVACSDCSVRILTIPLIPPSEGTKKTMQVQNSTLGVPVGQGHLRERMHIFSGSSGHRSPPRSVSVTLTARSSRSSADESYEAAKSWDLLIASHSADMSGLLLIHRIPFLGDGSDLNTEDLESDRPWRQQILASPARTVQFNPSLFPSTRHCQLLVAEAKGSVRIYDCRPEADRGSWLVTLYPPIDSSLTDTHQRKHLLTAQWVLGGKAVAVILADGAWGIWDLENTGPKAKQITDGWQASSGVRLDNFSINGSIGSSTAAKMASKSSKSTETRSKLAPMTPATRKARQETLFVGPAGKVSSPDRGGMSVCPTSDSLNNRKDDETLLLWHQDSITIIPSLLTYWHNKVKGSGNLFGKGAQGQPQEINNVHLSSEVRNAVSLIPNIRSTSSSTKLSKRSSFLVTGEHRIIIVTPPLPEPPQPVTRKPKSEVRSDTADQAMLEKSELDIDGIDSRLEMMSNGHQLDGFRANGTLPKRQANRLVS